MPQQELEVPDPGLSIRTQALLKMWERGYRVNDEGDVISMSGAVVGGLYKGKYPQVSIRCFGRNVGVNVHKLAAYQAFGEDAFAFQVTWPKGERPTPKNVILCKDKPNWQARETSKNRERRTHKNPKSTYYGLTPAEEALERRRLRAAESKGRKYVRAADRRGFDGAEKQDPKEDYVRRRKGKKGRGSQEGSGGGEGEGG